MIRVYLAAQYHRKIEIRALADKLHERGFTICSRWLDEPYNPQVELSECSEKELSEIAAQDLAEVLSADVVIFFSVSDQHPTRRNGRMVEFGAGLAAHKRMIVFGPRENIFHYLAGVEVYAGWDDVVQALYRFK